MARPIICGVDDSDVARAAVSVARDLGDRLATPLLLVHVAPARAPVGTAVVPYAPAEFLEGERRDGELLLAEQAVEARLGAAVERRVVFGDPVEKLVEVARAERAELLVLGSRGRGALASAVLGSVSTAAAAAAPCPVVIVPPAAARADDSTSGVATRERGGG